MITPELLWRINNYYQTIIAPKPPIMESPQIHPGLSPDLKLIIGCEELWDDLKPQLDSSQFFLLTIDGMPGSGKTTIAREFVHKAHGEGYKLLYASGPQIADAPVRFKQESAGHDKFVIVLDDISYILGSMNTKKQSKSKNYFSMIRHALKGKIFMIVIAHFSTAVPPFFKNTNVWLYSKPTLQEYDHMMKIAGKSERAHSLFNTIFNAVVEIQSNIAEDGYVRFNLAGNEQVFKWGSKTDPGDGRLVLLLSNGIVSIYNSKDILGCPMCSDMGRDVQVDLSQYVDDEKEDEKE